ncbi:hypothetical protein BJ508DRAFT_418296 [Ascobolus immersus RN42]|uniref:CBM-cenC domain-containing protein n=1 Tax=Ascobolus immersus RN42 TaxID=1160509 RepID=A0A3N4HMT1_ASCIM|nr:hypothetical protein BJ508DRAFT_418296 [Ascobolus immersus RN42]
MKLSLAFVASLALGAIAAPHHDDPWNKQCKVKTITKTKNIPKTTVTHYKTRTYTHTKSWCKNEQWPKTTTVTKTRSSTTTQSTTLTLQSTETIKSTLTPEAVTVTQTDTVDPVTVTVSEDVTLDPVTVISTVETTPTVTTTTTTELAPDTVTVTVTSTSTFIPAPTQPACTTAPKLIDGGFEEGTSGAWTGTTLEGTAQHSSRIGAGSLAHSGTFVFYSVRTGPSGGLPLVYEIKQTVKGFCKDSTTYTASFWALSRGVGAFANCKGQIFVDGNLITPEPVVLGADVVYNQVTSSPFVATGEEINLALRISCLPQANTNMLQILVDDVEIKTVG